VAMPGAQGGTYAAPVWNAFMTPAHGDYCGSFPQPTEAFQASPFFGKYASTGGANTGSYYDYSSDGGYTEDPDSGTDTGDTGDTSTGGGQYDPNLYESAPQPPPDVQAPPEAAPAPGTGGTGADG
jgi:penicillin-binding protein 1A